MPILPYEHPPSSHAQRAQIALRENKAPFAWRRPDSFGRGFAAGNEA